MPQINECSWVSLSILGVIPILSAYLSLAYQQSLKNKFNPKKKFHYFNLMK